MYYYLPLFLEQYVPRTIKRRQRRFLQTANVLDRQSPTAHHYLHCLLPITRPGPTLRRPLACINTQSWQEREQPAGDGEDAGASGGAVPQGIFEQRLRPLISCFAGPRRRGSSIHWSEQLQIEGKRGRPAGFKSAKSNIEQKMALFDTSGSSSHSKGDKDGDFEPPTPTRKRGRSAGSKCAERKTKQKRLLVYSSSSEGMKDKDSDFEPEVSDDDGGRKKYACVKSAAWERAVKVQEKLPAEGPSLVKLMLHSHVVKGFWLGLPAIFCRKHLPKHDVKIVLEDEEGQTCDTNYLAYKMGLSGGWRGFVEQHDLKVGDALVFQLVRPTIFKVYILREKKFTTTDGALGLLSLDASMENNTSKKEESSDEVTRVSSKPSTDDSNSLADEEAAGGGIISPGPDTGDFVNFKIVLGDGSVIGRRVLPDHLRRTYYHLCQAREAPLHRHLLKQISPALATAVIMETANIAEGIKASSPTSLEDLVGWKKTLESFEAMGMDVGFMRKRVDDLLGLLSAPLQISGMPEGYMELKLERARAAKQLKSLESRLSILKDSLKKMDVKMQEMVEASAKKKKKEQVVRELATAPW